MARPIRYDGPGAARAPVTPERKYAAERIVTAAREHAIPLHEDAGLIEVLARLEIGATVPREFFAVVAEVIAFVYALDESAAARG